jgi:glycosyltransferase involved in cell wall biosynthesis
MNRKSIALFYYTIVDDNAIGRCNRIVLEKLCEKYDYTVFAVNFDNPRPDRIRWVRVRCLQRPMFLFYCLFRIVAWGACLGRVIAMRKLFDLVVASDGCIDGAGLQHVHFCNRFYCKQFLRFRDLFTARGFASAVDHFFRAVWEGQLYRGVEQIVVPSEGLRQEIIDVYKVKPEHIAVIANPVDLTKYSPRPAEGARKRLELGLTETDFVCVFVALGHFERKGLGPLIDSLADPRMAQVRLLVVGGSVRATSVYGKRAKDLGVDGQVIFCGHHADTRPFLWCADAFVLPSRYETFSIVATEAAACGVPVITTSLNGVRDWARPGATGFVLPDPAASTIAEAVAALRDLSPADRETMGHNARNAVMHYGVDQYVKAFDTIYSQALSSRKSLPVTPQLDNSEI